MKGKCDFREVSYQMSVQKGRTSLITSGPTIIRAHQVAVSHQSPHCSLQVFILHDEKEPSISRGAGLIFRVGLCVSRGTEEWGREFIITPFQILWFKLTLAGPLQRQGKSPGDGRNGKVTSVRMKGEWMQAGGRTVRGSNLSPCSEAHIRSEPSTFILFLVSLLVLL